MRDGWRERGKRERGKGTSEDGVQRQEISPDRRADHGEGEEEEFEDYGAGEVVSDSA